MGALSTIKSFTVAPGDSEAWTALAFLAGSESIVFTKIIPPGGGFVLASTSLIGRGDGFAKVIVDGVQKDYMQIVWTHRADQRQFGTGILVPGGGKIEISLKSFAENACDFFGSINGVLL